MKYISKIALSKDTPKRSAPIIFFYYPSCAIKNFYNNIWKFFLSWISIMYSRLSQLFFLVLTFLGDGNMLISA